MLKRPLIIMGASVPLLGITGLIVYGLLFFSYGPRPISLRAASGLLNNCEDFRLGATETREVETVTSIERASPSEVNNYYADFVWRWKFSSERMFESISKFEYKKKRWNLTGFRNEDGQWVEVRCGN